MSAELTQTSSGNLGTSSSGESVQLLSLPDDLRDWLVDQALTRSAEQQWSSASERFSQIHSDAIQTLKATAFPTRKTESWRYTSIQPLIAAINGVASTTSSGTTSSRSSLSSQALQNIVAEADLVVRFSDNGCASIQFAESEAAHLLSVTLNQTSDGPVVTSAEQADLLGEFGQRVPEGYYPFVSVNAALLSSCLEISVAAVTGEQASLKPRILLLDGGDGGQNALLTQQHRRVLLKLAHNAHTELTEIRLDSGSSTAFATSVLEASLEASSVLEHFQFAAAAAADCLYSATFVRLGHHARYAFNGQSTGSALSRTDLTVELSAPGAYAAVNAHMLLNGSNRCDYHTSLEHIAAHCESDEQVRSIVSDRGKAIFNGRIHIHRDAQKTRAEMNNRNLLMSPQAEVNTKPELEIYADDVKCAHGATIGQLDANAVFYCKSRGIDEQSARALLSEAFIVETIQLMPAQRQQDLAMAILQDFQETV